MILVTFETEQGSSCLELEHYSIDINDEDTSITLYANNEELPQLRKAILELGKTTEPDHPKDDDR